MEILLIQDLNIFELETILMRLLIRLQSTIMQRSDMLLIKLWLTHVQLFLEWQFVLSVQPLKQRTELVMMELVSVVVIRISITILQLVHVQLVPMNVLLVGDQVNINALVALKASSILMRGIHVLNGWAVEMGFEMLLKNVTMEILKIMMDVLSIARLRLDGLVLEVMLLDQTIVQFHVEQKVILGSMNVGMGTLLMGMDVIVFVELNLDGTVSMEMNSIMRLAMSFVETEGTLVSMNVMTEIELILMDVISTVFKKNKELKLLEQIHFSQ